MTTLAVVVTCEQPPEARIVYVTVYVPAVEALGLIAPVAPSRVKPAVELNVPPLLPVNVTTPLVTLLQKGVPP